MLVGFNDSRPVTIKGLSLLEWYCWDMLEFVLTIKSGFTSHYHESRPYFKLTANRAEMSLALVLRKVPTALKLMSLITENRASSELSMRGSIPEDGASSFCSTSSENIWHGNRPTPEERGSNILPLMCISNSPER